MYVYVYIYIYICVCVCVCVCVLKAYLRHISVQIYKIQEERNANFKTICP